ncbi:serine hydrolase domain-containing protein [Christiangramia sp.]|uniref:serine hydrolase domain-containing protein n=1 Tax=Christiangramia sp. TaxID=1931228 RepID=UPI00262FAB53|nr:serine hydrolase domain-containing protein [Christiangramia sp.]
MRSYYVVLVLFLSFLAFPSSAQEVLNEAKSAEIDAYVREEMKERQIPGLALAVVQNGKIIKEKGYGLADIQHQVPVETNTVFELASITKQFTASAIMILQQEGKLDVDDKIGLYLDDAPENWNEVSIRHLLTHTSGLPVIGRGFSGYDKMSREDLLKLSRVNFTKELAYTGAKSDTLVQPPGEKYVYSDVAFFLLGVIVQNVSGMPYRDFIQERIFDPVGMSETYILDQVKIHPNEARGYTLRDGELVNIRRIWEYEIPSHYGVFSTVGDLAKWDKALYSEEILTNKSKEQMWQPMMRNNGIPSPYGFGWTIWLREDKKIIDHTGITGTQITRFLNDSLTVIVLTNLGQRGNSNVRSWGLSSKIGDMAGASRIYIDNEYTTLTGAKVLKNQPGKKLKELVGDYKMSGSGAERKIYFENEKLFYKNGDGINQLVALDNDQYLMLGTTDEWLLEKVPGENKLQWRYKGQKSGMMEKTENK